MNAASSIGLDPVAGYWSWLEAAMSSSKMNCDSGKNEIKN